MAGTLKKVRFKLAWQSYSVGDTITPNAMLRDWLVANGYADIVDDVPQLEQTAHPKVTREVRPRGIAKRA